MSLDFAKLQNVRRLTDGAIQAQCPACAQNGMDKKGNHLRVQSSGAYGCVLHKGDKEHTKLIYALAGGKGARSDEFNFSNVERTEKPQVEEIYPDEILQNLIVDDTYWKTRGIGYDILKEFDGGLASRGKMNKRYCFAIRDSNNRIIGFTGRIIDNSSDIKWKHLGKTANWIFPFPKNKQAFKDTKKVILVESIGDMLALWRCGIKNTLVLFGVSISQILISTIIGINPDKIIIATNNDEINNAGQNAAKRIKERLDKFFDQDSVKICLPLKKDFGIMSDEEILNWNEHAN